MVIKLVAKSTQKTSRGRQYVGKCEKLEMATFSCSNHAHKSCTTCTICINETEASHSIQGTEDWFPTFKDCFNYLAESRAGTVVRALAFRQCGRGFEYMYRTQRYTWIEFVVGSRSCSAGKLTLQIPV